MDINLQVQFFIPYLVKKFGCYFVFAVYVWIVPDLTVDCAAMSKQIETDSFRWRAARQQINNNHHIISSYKKRSQERQFIEFIFELFFCY